MNKKYLSAILFGALLASSMGTFTSCKDYDDDIKGLQEQIDNNGGIVGTIQAQLTTLQAAADAAKKAADEAKVAAEAAKTAGDTAKALAEEAKAAAAQAKAEAIAQASKDLKAVKESLEAAIASKVDTSVYEAKVKELGAAIDGIEDGLSSLANGAVKDNADDIKSLQDAVETLKTADSDLKVQLRTLELYAEATRGMVEDNEVAIAKAQENISILLDKIETLEGRIDGELDAIRKDITTIQGDIRKINEEIKLINADLASLHTLMVCRLTSIALRADDFLGGIPAIQFSSLIYDAMAVNENAEVPSKYKFSLGAPAIARYAFNPRSFNLDNATYAYNATVANTRSVAVADNWVTIESKVKNAVEGSVDFTLRRLNAHSTQAQEGKVNTISMEATLIGKALDAKENVGDVVISSEQSAIDDVILSAADVRIADKATLAKGDEAHYATTFNACRDEAPRYTVPYDQVLDLKKLVATCYGNDNHAEFPIADYKLSYKFYVASTKYEITEGETATNQQKWVKCNDAVAGTFQAEGFNPEAFGRTPILKVELVDEAGLVVRRGFVKIEFVAEKQPDFTVGNEAYNLVVNCNDTKESYTITEDFIRENVYRKITNGTNIGMSHEQFWNTYDVATATTAIKKNGKAISMTSVPEIVDGATDAGTATKKVVWSFTHKELGAIGASGSQFVATITVKNKLQSDKHPDKITFQFTVNVTIPQFTLTSTKNEQYWQTVNGELAFFKVNVNVPSTPEEFSDNCLFNQDLKLAYLDTYKVNGLPTCVTDRYVVTRTFSNGTATSSILTGVQISGTHILLNKNNDAVKAALNSAGGLQASVAHVYTLESGDQITVNTFMVVLLQIWWYFLFYCE